MTLESGSCFSKKITGPVFGSLRTRINFQYPDRIQNPVKKFTNMHYQQYWFKRSIRPELYLIFLPLDPDPQPWNALKCLLELSTASISVIRLDLNISFELHLGRHQKNLFSLTPWCLRYYMVFLVSLFVNDFVPMDSSYLF